MSQTARGRLWDAVVGGASALGLGLAIVAQPARGLGGELSWPGGAPVLGACLMSQLLGVPCPFCGATRSVVALVHGDLPGALAFHPAAPLLVFALVGVFAAIVILALARGRPLVTRPGFLRAVHLTLLLAGLAGAARWLLPL